MRADGHRLRVPSSAGANQLWAILGMLARTAGLRANSGSEAALIASTVSAFPTPSALSSSRRRVIPRYSTMWKPVHLHTSTHMTDVEPLPRQQVVALHASQMPPIKLSRCPSPSERTDAEELELARPSHSPTINKCHVRTVTATISNLVAK